MYPILPKDLYKNNDIKIHFKLTNDERKIIKQARNKKNELGFAILLKTYFYLGFAPSEKAGIPHSIIRYISEQLEAPYKLFKEFKWKGRSFERYLSEIRKITGLKSINRSDYSMLLEDLVYLVEINPSHKQLLEEVIKKCRELKLELPREKVLNNLVFSAYNKYFNTLFHYLFKKLSNKTRKDIEQVFNRVLFLRREKTFTHNLKNYFLQKSLYNQFKNLHLIITI